MAWDFGDGASSSSMASVIHEYTNPGEFHTTLTITDNHGCRYSDTLNVPMRVFPSPQAKFKIAEQQLYLPETTVHILNQSDGASTFLWRFDHFGQSTENAPTFDFPYNTEGRYEISLTAKNTFGCYSEAKHEVTITQDISLFMPNAFTPDGDGVNDSWGISGLGVDAFRFNIEIYDAWGVVVFASEDIQAQWFGESASTGENAHPGMYNYRVLARDTEHGVGHLFEGHVQLLR
jgi:gliding motility-associated-like protein